MGYLKRLPRAGWFVANVAGRTESVGEHSFRVAIIGVLLAGLEGADPARTALLCLLHDTQETRTGDVPGVGKAYVRTVDNVTVTGDQVAGFPRVLAESLITAVGEYEARESVEALLARDADKLECLLQAREYQAAGNLDVQPWIESSFAALRSATAKRLGMLCQEMAPREWWAQAAAQYPQSPRETPH